MKHRCSVAFLIFLLLTACGGDGTPATSGDVEPTKRVLAETPGDTAATGTVIRLAQQGGDIEVRLDNAVDLYGLHIHIEFDPEKMQVKDANPDQEGVQVAPGDIPVPDFVALNQVDNEQGVIDYAVVQTSPREATSGSGVVALIQVQEGSLGEDLFTVFQVELSDPNGNALAVQVDGN